MDPIRVAAASENCPKEIIGIQNKKANSLKSLLTNANLNISDLNVALLERLNEVSEKIVENNLGEISRASIVAALATATLDRSENLSKRLNLRLVKTSIDNQKRSCAKIHSRYRKAIRVSKSDISEMEDQLANIDEPLSPLTTEPDTGRSHDSQEALSTDICRKITAATLKLVERTAEFDQLNQNLRRFRNLPPDVDRAWAEIELKKQELKQLNEDFDFDD